MNLSRAPFLERSRLVAAMIFIVTVAAILVISYVGITPIDLPVMTGQMATTRIVASTSFSFQSAEKTQAATEAAVRRIPPVYRLELSTIQQFDPNLRALVAQLEDFERRFPPNSPAVANRQMALRAIVDAFNLKGPYTATYDDVVAFLGSGDARQRKTKVENGLSVLRDIYARGIRDGALERQGELGGVIVYQVIRPTGEIAERPVQSITQALSALHANLAADTTLADPNDALFRIFRQGLTPNLVYDQDSTDRRKAGAVEAVRPVRVAVEPGQTIIEQGKRVSPEQYEMLMAQRKALENEATATDDGLRLFGPVLLVLAMVVASVVYICIEDRETLQSNTRLGLLALVVIINLALVRATYSLAGLRFFLENGGWASVVPYIAPTALAPLIVAIMIDAGSAIFMALLISIFTGVIYGNRLDLLVLTFLASMVAIFAARDVRKRTRVVRAAGFGGLTVACFALLIGVIDQVPATTLLRQMGAGMGTFLFTGVLVVGVLPVLEGLFKRTTDITLLELTDFNHPLLRLMQLEAPGTYHHSIVVAHLAENACNAIGANPLLARVCALFHDVGKTAQPEYFTENQTRGTASPHAAETPVRSAAIIKAHVPNGVELARKHHLPKAVVDVIQQHHGTSLVRYFYDRAVAASATPFSSGASRLPDDDFRYDGPRPQFKESAVISLADAVEAASRSLREVDAQQIGAMIDVIFADRIKDGQLDEAPLTFAELAQLKSSFTFSLLNMLHARTEYPAPESRAQGQEPGSRP